MTKRIEAKKKISRKLGGSLWGQAKDPYLKRDKSNFCDKNIFNYLSIQAQINSKKGKNY